jgi:hypothetical protein
MEHVTEIVVPAAPAEAYAYVADFRNEVEWRVDVDSSELQSGTAGSDSAVYLQKVTAGKRHLENVVTVTGADGETVTFTTTSGATVAVEGSHRVVAKDAGSRIILTVAVTPHGLSKLLSPLVKAELRRLSEHYAVDLTAALSP